MIWSLVWLSALTVQSMSQLTDTTSTCNNCCQGPIGPHGPPGIPGVPGNHGTNGIPGGVGPKGDAGIGIRGDIGPRGDSGVRGEKGERGEPGARGLPGKMGPFGRGERGLKGEPGSEGRKGDRGDPGTSMVQRRSAFTAVKTTPQSARLNIAVIFESTVTNIGNDYDISTGKFTCRVPGVYQFTFHVNADEANADAGVALVKNNNIQVGSVHDATGGKDLMFGNAAIIQLVAGDQVWLKFLDNNGEVDTHNAHWRLSSFSGILMYED